MNVRERRGFLAGCAALAAASLPHAARAAEERRYGVVSLIGDQITVVYKAMTTGSAMDRNVRHSVADPAGAFDRYALGAVGAAIGKTQESARVEMLSVAPSPLHEQPEKLLDGKTIALPDDLVGSIEQVHATHVVLLTKQRAEAMVPMRQGHLGVGMLRGLGYYIDSDTRIRMVESGAVAHGFIAPYVHVQLTLADARSGAVLSQRSIAASRAYPVASSVKAVDPWQVLSTEEKVNRLRQLLERELAAEVPRLIAGA
jgi:hypothetical protein